MSYHLYDINKAWDDFTLRFGIEPNGVLMNEVTFTILKNEMSDHLNKVSDTAQITFRGTPIFKSNDINSYIIRFVI